MKLYKMFLLRRELLGKLVPTEATTRSGMNKRKPKYFHPESGKIGVLSEVMEV